jgi:L-ascorbate metabolism protein UlaG (beta-lactamase superfamily)
MAEILYLGHASVRIRGREGIVVLDPCDQSVGFDIGKPTAQVVTISHHKADHNNVEAVKPLRDTLFVADGPGEYEVSNILIRGIRTAHTDGEGKKHGHNTIFVMYIDDVAFCHLGDLGHGLTASQLDEIGSVDVLFVPVGNGNHVIKPDGMVEIISEIAPKVVVPLYNDNQQQRLEALDLEPLSVFVHQMGLKEYETLDKVVFTPSTLPREDEETKIMILNPSAAAV